jgi:hypothetical protein
MSELRQECKSDSYLVTLVIRLGAKQLRLGLSKFIGFECVYLAATRRPLTPLLRRHKWIFDELFISPKRSHSLELYKL